MTWLAQGGFKCFYPAYVASKVAIFENRKMVTEALFRRMWLFLPPVFFVIQEKPHSITQHCVV